MEEKVDFSLEDTELIINSDFFNNPKQIFTQLDINTPFSQCLQCYGLNHAAATSICQRLPSDFVFALNQEWHARPSDYESINRFFKTPVSEAAERERAWQLYNAWLHEQIDERMFAEAFGLRKVYIHPRAYYEQEIENSDRESFTDGRRVYKKYQKIVVDLENNLTTWIKKADSRDAIRIISGDPGSGKPSFSKILAAKLSEAENIRILFIPLHLFDYTGDLVDAMGEFIRYDKYLSHNPLDREQESDKLLIIFDGLDELAMQGNIGAEVANDFLGEVQDKVQNFNQQVNEACVQVIITGRPVIISSVWDKLEETEQILHILPYNKDQRNSWWIKYGLVTRKNYSAMPEELNLVDNLKEITTQPLLNYLIAFSYAQSKDDIIEDKDKIIFSEGTNINSIYQYLLESFHGHGWNTYQYSTLKGVKYENFVQILEEIALVAWHSNGRICTVEEIESHCQNSDLKDILQLFKKGAESGVTNLLIAFYFRQHTYGRDSDNTFEFTHKSFGEYLTARRIVRELSTINKELKNRDEDPDEGWDKKQALIRWIIICGMSAIDQYLFKFICDEIALEQTETVKQWQKSLSDLISFMLRQGMPMERVNPRPDYKEECRQGRNAEEALLVVVNACAMHSKERSNINWQSEYSFVKWLSRLQNHDADDEQIIVNQCLNWLNFEKANLYRANLYRANLEGAILRRANLRGAILRRANLEGTNLVRANLYGAILYGAILVRAILGGANLQGANLQGANLQGANLREAILREANLYRANLRGANLRGAILYRANLRGAILQGANLDGSNLEGANLDGSNLEGAILQGTILREANLRGANLVRANLYRANLRGANLGGTILREANLEEAIMDDDVRRQIE